MANPIRVQRIAERIREELAEILLFQMTDPRLAGRHAVTGKAIKPMAPAVNPARFTDPKKVEKWFRRNCRDVLERECTSGEQADVVAYLRSLAPSSRP